MINEKEKEQIRKEAKRIIDDFASALDKVKIKMEKVKKLHGGYRKEGLGEKGDNDFRTVMFENAPEKEEDFMVAEKKKWQ